MSDYVVEDVIELPIAELKLGMVARLFPGAYGWGTVTKLDEKEVTFTRPYVHHSAFATTGGVVSYLGFEVFARSRETGVTIPVDGYTFEIYGVGGQCEIT